MPHTPATTDGADSTIVALARDAGKTADAMRRDREAMFASAPPPQPAVTPVQDPEPPTPRTPGGTRIENAPKGFDPYIMNGRGPNDERDLENVGKSSQWRQVNCVVM